MPRQVVSGTRSLRTGAARSSLVGLGPEQRLPCGEEASVASSCSVSNQPGARAQLSSHRCAQGYELAVRPEGTQSGELQPTRPSLARTARDVGRSLPCPRTRLLTMPTGDRRERSHVGGGTG